MPVRVKREGSSQITVRLYFTQPRDSAVTSTGLSLAFWWKSSVWMFETNCSVVTLWLSREDLPFSRAGWARQTAWTVGAPYSEAPPAPRPSDEGPRQQQLTPSLSCSTSSRKSASWLAFQWSEKENHTKEPIADGGLICGKPWLSWHK